jgi:hypothetical protein
MMRSALLHYNPFNFESARNAKILAPTMVVVRNWEHGRLRLAQVFIVV